MRRQTDRTRRRRGRAEEKESERATGWKNGAENERKADAMSRDDTRPARGAPARLTRNVCGPIDMRQGMLLRAARNSLAGSGMRTAAADAVGAAAAAKRQRMSSIYLSTAAGVLPCHSSRRNKHSSTYSLALKISSRCKSPASTKCCEGTAGLYA